ncbi:MAG TPA: acyl-[acyl-carrier-protein]--UDP-N-acetylglucosamine O-acyltransferase [Bacteroidales bacterium]|jgi:UDP-N-acetylglucosamine acyltransferase|nr:acyl-[acyl-carrier-protein]--UDP-N-acetylglucosamine O-acyltransferase [Bacteroidales bacterium]
MSRDLAYIHPEAKIGKDVKIDAFAWIDKNVEIGDGTWIGPNATLMEGARIGKNCKIFPGAVVSAIPQDLKFKGEETTAEIGDNTTLRECVTVNRGTASKGKTVVGNNCLLMAYVHIGHDSKLGNNIIISNSTNVAGEIIIDDFAVISGDVQIHQFVHIGGHVMVSGGSLVRKDIPPYVTVAHEPVSYVGVNSIGLRRRNFSNEIIAQIQDIYREIFVKEQNVSQALKYIEAEIPVSPERDYILNFIKNSERGVIRGYNGA